MPSNLNLDDYVKAVEEGRYGKAWKLERLVYLAFILGLLDSDGNYKS